MENKDYLRKLQLTELEILDEIVRICEKNNLRYYLIGGTLLGAIRHNGFIPWDDDLDIAMPRRDYDMFRELCKTELNENYFLHDIYSDNKYWLLFAKVRKKNTLFEEKNISTIKGERGIYVDIFPLDNALCENSREQRIRTRIIKYLNAVIAYKRKLNLRFSWKTKITSFFIYPFSIKTLKRIQEKLMRKHNKNEASNFYINFGSNYNTIKQTILKSYFEPASEVIFEGKKYTTLKDPVYFLKRIYGNDFMMLPPEEKRITHSPLRISFDLKGEVENEKV